MIQMTGRWKIAPAAIYLFNILLFVEFAGVFLFAQMPRAIEALATLATAVRAIGQEDQNPKFQKAPALGAMNVLTAAKRTNSFTGVGKQAKDTFHRERMIAPVECGRNRHARPCCRSSISADQKDARTCIA
jgi:hypothetical protein